MVISRKLLNDDEFVVVSTRTHVKALLLPAVLLIVIAAVAGYLTTLPSGDPRQLLVLVIWIVALGVIVWWVLRPFLVWLSATYTVTNRRLITRRGVLTRRGHDIPLHRISDVAYEHGLLDRILGCGTLVISDASEFGRVELHDIPQVEQVQLAISELLSEGADDGS
ncbi:MAG TPA: PH domain-containing protein [Nocardioidaceae bacterium]|nr:PH domain-containing protein [Nocardioidaceae bacterium]